MQKVILYYKFVPVTYPEAVRLWQKAMCEKLNLRGRIIISKHGINGTLGGELGDLKKYAQDFKSFAPFHGTALKWGDGGREDFPKLSVKVRDEIVTFGAADELKVDENGVVGGGIHLSPEAVHELVKERGTDVVFLDGRSAYEAAVGKFKRAVVPQVDTCKDFIREIEKLEYEVLKDKPVVTYCTGGIRCEVLSVLMRNRGFQEVYQLDGGIINYGETYGDDGLWEGSLYVFDNRMGIKFSDRAKDIGRCTHCQNTTSRYINCANPTCNKLMLMCMDCHEWVHCKPCES